MKDEVANLIELRFCQLNLLQNMFSKSTQKTDWYDGNLYMHDFHATRQTKEIPDRSFWKIIETMKHVETEKSFIYGI